MTKKKNPSIFACALAVNILYYILCVIIYKIDSDNQIVNIVFFALSVMLWLGVGLFYSKKTGDFTFSKGIKLILLGFLPILFFMIAYTVLLYMTVSNQTYNWILFYSIGAPILFWIKPAIFLINFFNVDFYVFAYVYIAGLIVAFIIGMSIPKIAAVIKNKKTIEHPLDSVETLAEEPTAEIEQAAEEAAITVSDDQPGEDIAVLAIDESIIIEPDAPASTQDTVAPSSQLQENSDSLEADYDFILDQINFNDLQTNYSQINTPEELQSTENIEENSNKDAENDQ
jgi:hypothetical protein